MTKIHVAYGLILAIATYAWITKGMGFFHARILMAIEGGDTSIDCACIVSICSWSGAEASVVTITIVVEYVGAHGQQFLFKFLHCRHQSVGAHVLKQQEGWKYSHYFILSLFQIEK